MPCRILRGLKYTNIARQIKSYKPELLITYPVGHGACSIWCCLFRNSVLNSRRIPYLPFKIFPAYLKKIKEYLSLIAVGTWNNIYSPPTDLGWATWHRNRTAFQLGSQTTGCRSSQGTARSYSYVITCLHFEISSS